MAFVASLSLTLSQLLVVIACGVAAVYALVLLAFSIRASRWPSVDGEIAETHLVGVPDTEGSHLSEYVAYRYTVGGRPYRNDRIRFGPHVRARSSIPQNDPEPDWPAAKAELEQHFPPGRPVRVFYDPRRPENSVLVRSPSPFVWILLGAAGVFAYGALFGHR
ncbi:MAG: hypothetical protein DMD35_18215 [Gemmatimonadetes bacterium]|nr:MAG: hypothetical protein DMD35_18215 [Gemmatimonadota bacterium]